MFVVRHLKRTPHTANKVAEYRLGPLAKPPVFREASSMTVQRQLRYYDP